MDFDAEKFQSLKCTPVVSLTKLLMRGCKKKKFLGWGDNFVSPWGGV